MMAVNLLPIRPIGGVGNNPGSTPGSPELRIDPTPGPGIGVGPDPRAISNIIAGSNGDGPGDPNLSDWLYVFGQFIDHDLDLESPTGSAINITIPVGDPSVPAGGTIPLNRAILNPTTNTITNTVAGFLDLSQVYGSDVVTAASLRNTDGNMKTSAGNALSIVGGVFVAGDVRVMENPELTAVTTLFVREHNYWVGQLRAQHPTWTGDQLYDEAKTLTTAEYQNIVYSEYLPALIGSATPKYHGYSPSTNAQVTQEFSTAAFRVGHSQISATQNRIDNNGVNIGTQTLAQSFFNTPAQDVANGIDALIRNLGSDNGQATDVYAINDLRNLLVAPPDTIDLIAIDVQRERDIGIGTLNQTRAALGLPAYTSFSQITSDPVVQANLAQVFGTVDNVDLFIGGLAENHVNDGVVGQTFSAIIAGQFDRLETGDKFFWLHNKIKGPTKDIISQTTLGDIIERNTGTPIIQSNVFLATQRVSSDIADHTSTANQLVIGIDTPGAAISGGLADDTLVAGAGLHQVLIGGIGHHDTFAFIGTGHQDTIEGWRAGDKISFEGTFSNANITIVDHTPKVLTTVMFGGNTIDIVGGPKLSAGDFLLPPTGMIPHIIHA